MSGHDVTARLRALLAAGTPGPWKTNNGRPSPDGPGLDVSISGPGFAVNIVRADGSPNNEANAALIAESRNVLGELLAVVEAVAENGPGHDDRGFGCPHCHAMGAEGTLVHAPDCAWVLSRKLTGGGG
jgi:hypothetical protein